MRATIILVILFCGFMSLGQQVRKDSSFFPNGFDYARDFKVIVEKSRDKTSDFYYHKLLAKFLNEDSTITRAETLALMIGYTEDPHFKPWKDMETEKEIFDLNDSADYEGSLEASKTYLNTHPLSLRVLKERSFSYNQLKNKDSAQFFMDMVDRVMSAMIYSGKGKTPETPIFSLGLADGEYFIPNVGMSVAGKSTDWNKHKHFVEVIDAMNEMGEHNKFYFVIQHAKEKIDDDEVNDAPVKKSKKSKKSKTSKKVQAEKATTDSIPAGN
ncbi:MAG: DUF4919 domain-containing protein [Ferruginibacter sp.]|nr:DUF4919 domain-containing protein [Ferruginibacter sp.]